MPDTLQNIHSPSDVRALMPEDLVSLAAEVRAELLRIVSRQGGHLASNLGVVELTIALLHVFDLDRDRIIWDTGHQSYVYKLLTGRRKEMEHLREDDGCCGFLNRDESPYDVFGAGHAGTAISAALGFAAARDRAQVVDPDGKVIAVVGDGALGCGCSLEGLNNIIETTKDFILVLNDNKMSISPNVGALSRALNRMMSEQWYNRLKGGIRQAIMKIPGVGRPLRRIIHRVEEAAKTVLLPGVLFQEFGLRYMGPLDGHDIPSLLKIFRMARDLKEPLLIHVLTCKGQGYRRAEEAPEIYHGTGTFDLAAGCLQHPADGDAEGNGKDMGFSSVFGRELVRLAEKDERIVAITAGMCHGTGLQEFHRRFPGRFFDVGIAEEHAVIFASGMAAAGLRPVVAIYASFMQRAMDYVYHDVCLQRLPVVFCLDRAGVVPDGPTHHGILDTGFWRVLPGLEVLQPADCVDVREALAYAVSADGPTVIRYPKACADALPVVLRTPWRPAEAEQLRDGDDAVIWAVGGEVVRALEVADSLAHEGLNIGVVNVRSVQPLDKNLLGQHVSRGLPIVVLEDHYLAGGFGEALSGALPPDARAKVLVRGWPQEVIPWGTVAGIREKFRLDTPALIADIRTFVQDSSSRNG